MISIASDSAQLLLPNCIHFNCCSTIVSAPATAPRLCLPQLLLPYHDRLSYCQLPNCIQFSCCSPVVSACSPRHSGRFQPLSNVLDHSLLSLEVRVTSPAPQNIPLPYAQTDTHTHIKIWAWKPAVSPCRASISSLFFRLSLPKILQWV